jgi:hypothetical protein
MLMIGATVILILQIKLKFSILSGLPKENSIPVALCLYFWTLHWDASLSLLMKLQTSLANVRSHGSVNPMGQSKGWGYVHRGQEETAQAGGQGGYVAEM